MLEEVHSAQELEGDDVADDPDGVVHLVDGRQTVVGQVLGREGWVPGVEGQEVRFPVVNVMFLYLKLLPDLKNVEV